jgi:hypothetical protein
LIVAPAGVITAVEVALCIGVAGALVLGRPLWDEEAAQVPP